MSKKDGSVFTLSVMRLYARDTCFIRNTLFLTLSFISGIAYLN